MRLAIAKQPLRQPGLTSDEHERLGRNFVTSLPRHRNVASLPINAPGKAAMAPALPNELESVGLQNTSHIADLHDILDSRVELPSMVAGIDNQTAWVE